MERVADVLERWAREMRLGEDQVARWRAAGHLHDALRDASPEALAGALPKRLRALPRRAYHGPAAADRLRDAGVADRELLRAIRWHTLGSPKFGTLGKALYAADFLEPERRPRRRWREDLRSRAHRRMDEVVAEIVASKIDHLVRSEMPVHPRTIRFWNALVNGA